MKWSDGVLEYRSDGQNASRLLLRFDLNVLNVLNDLNGEMG